MSCAEIESTCVAQAHWVYVLEVHTGWQKTMTFGDPCKSCSGDRCACLVTIVKPYFRCKIYSKYIITPVLYYR